MIVLGTWNIVEKLISVMRGRCVFGEIISRRGVTRSRIIVAATIHSKLIEI